MDPHGQKLEMSGDIPVDQAGSADYWPQFAASGDTPALPVDFPPYANGISQSDDNNSTGIWMPPHGSDPYSAQDTYNAPSNHSNIYLQLFLSHKPRSLSGAAETITEGFRLRVDKSAGKNIIVSIASPVPCDWSTLRLRLAGGMSGDQDDLDDGFKIDPSGPKPTADGLHCEVTIKLLSQGRTVALDAAVTTLDGTAEIYGRSVHFLTHNSGPPSKKRKLSSGGHSSVGASERFLATSTPPESASVSPSAQAGGMSPSHSSPSSGMDDSPQAAAQAPSEWTNVNSNLQVNGVVRARGYITYSDLRLKSSIEDIVDAMHIVCSLKAHKFEWNPDLIETESGGRKVIGFLAQEVQKVLPDVVEKTSDGWLTVNYVEILPVLLEAFKQHVKESNESSGRLSAEILDLRSEVDKLTLQHQESTALQLYNAFLSLHQRLKQASLRQRQIRSTRNVPPAWRPAAQPRPFVQVSRPTLAPQNVSRVAPVPSRVPVKVVAASASPLSRPGAAESDGDDDYVDGNDDYNHEESEDVSENEEESDAFISSSRRRRDYDDREVELTSFSSTARRNRSRRSRGDDVPVTREEMRRYIEAVELSAALRKKTVDCTPLLVFYRLVVIILLIIIIVEIGILFTPSPMHELNAYLKRNNLAANMTLSFGLPIYGGDKRPPSN